LAVAVAPAVIMAAPDLMVVRVAAGVEHIPIRDYQAATGQWDKGMRVEMEQETTAVLQVVVAVVAPER